MNRCCTILLILPALYTPLIMAAENTPAASNKETVGFGIGALIGGLIAGPPGVVIGAAGGTLFGNHSAERDNTIADLEKRLQDKTIEFGHLQNEFANAQSEYAQTLHKVNLENKQAALKELSEGVSFQVFFRTDKANIDPILYPHIQELVALIREFPEIKVQLEAYADRRGKSEYNMTLSLSRAVAVQAELIKAGLPIERIQRHAYGESRARAGEKDYEGYVFDRRVDIHLTLDTEV